MFALNTSFTWVSTELGITCLHGIRVVQFGSNYSHCTRGWQTSRVQEQESCRFVGVTWLSVLPYANQTSVSWRFRCPRGHWIVKELASEHICLDAALVDLKKKKSNPFKVHESRSRCYVSVFGNTSRSYTVAGFVGASSPSKVFSPAPTCRASICPL